MNKERDPIVFCAHVRVRKGYYMGLSTEDYVCVECGKSGAGPDWPKLELGREQRRLHTVSTRIKGV